MRHLISILLPIAFIFSICLGGMWIVFPTVVSDSEDKRSDGYTDKEVERLRAKYPIHLINPTAANFRRWPHEETGARLGVVIVGSVIIYVLVRFIRREKPSA